MSSAPVDYVIVGLGVPGEQNISSRQNAGWIFLDYLSNCMCMQESLIAEELKQFEAGGVLSKDQPLIAPKYNVPVYTRSPTGDILDIQFSLTAEDVSTVNGKKPITPGFKPFEIERSYRLILIKPFTTPETTGPYIKHMLSTYNVTNPEKQLVVIHADAKTMPGTLRILLPNDKKQTKNTAVASINKACGGCFSFGIGLGHAAINATDDTFLQAKFTTGDVKSDTQNEIDMFGHTMDLCAQAFQFLAFTKNADKMMKKFSMVKKLPKLRQGVVFPYKVIDANVK